jgi:hypothetical protein
LKAQYDKLEALLKSAGAASQQAAAVKDKAKFGGELDDYDKKELRAEITSYNEWNASGDASKDKAAGQVLLQQLEDGAKQAMMMAKAKMEKRANDETKKAYYDALKIYEFLDKELGPNSPAKAAGKIAATKAAKEAALQDLAGKLGRAKNIQDVVSFIKDASKNTSPLPDLMGQSRTDDTMLEVFNLVSEDKKLAKKLAEKLLAAKTESDAAAAFADIRQESVTQGTDDPEVIMRAKLDGLVAKYVMGGELAMAAIKDQFNKNASGAQTTQQLDQA